MWPNSARLGDKCKELSQRRARNFNTYRVARDAVRTHSDWQHEKQV